MNIQKKLQFGEEMGKIHKKKNEGARLSPLRLSYHNEKKIWKVIEYIENNYTFDISREGLAAYVDVHPDNLGKFFLWYTDRKISDFINELRIKEAAQKLIESDDSILDIASSVGFDSLRTFNRLFPKYMDTAPKNYRKRHREISSPSQVLAESFILSETPG